MRSRNTLHTLLFLLIALTAIAYVQAAPTNSKTLKIRQSSSGSGFDDAWGEGGTSEYYEWIPVDYEKHKNWEAYEDHHLVKADYPDEDKTDIYVCLVKFPSTTPHSATSSSSSSDPPRSFRSGAPLTRRSTSTSPPPSWATYRIGYFDPSSDFECTVVYGGEEFEADGEYDEDSGYGNGEEKYESYYLSLKKDRDAKWVGWKEVVTYDDSHIVYAPDHDTLPGQVCWAKDKEEHKDDHKYGDDDKKDDYEDKKDDHDDKDSGSSYSKKRRSLLRLNRRSLLKKRQDYGSGGDHKEEKSYDYCSIGYGNSTTDYKIWYVASDDVHESEDIRYNEDVKILVIEYGDEEVSGGSLPVSEAKKRKKKRGRKEM